MKQYEPELGQAVFGQPYKQYEAPEWLIAFLEYINNELCRVMWNNNQEEYASPFANTGNSFKNDVFEVQAYSWNEDVEQPYNFKYGNIEISWYKHLDRGDSLNREITLDEGVQMLNECLASIRKMEKRLF